MVFTKQVVIQVLACTHLAMYVPLQSLNENATGALVSEQLLMSTEQVGILVFSTINTTSNQTVRTIINTNIGIIH